MELPRGLSILRLEIAISSIMAQPAMYFGCKDNKKSRFIILNSL